MSTKLAWVRSFPSDCLAETNGMKAFQIATYVTLKWHMRKSGEPIFCDQDKLAHSAGCSKKIFNKALEFLLRDKKIICLDDGRLWSLQVEEELNNSNENLSKFSERAQKAAKARWDKNKDNSDDDAKDATSNASSNATSNAQAMLNDANHNHNHNHIYNKKNKTIVLSKKEIDFEDLETTDLVGEPIEGDDVQSEQIETGVENQPPIHEQENVSKKPKRSKANRDCHLPNDFEPNLQYAIDKGLTHDEALLEFERFKLHWQDNPNRNAKKSDWQKAWYQWITNPKYGLLAQKKEKLEREKQYAKQSNQHTEQQRGWSYRVAQHMSNIKNSDSVYKFLFEDDNASTIPLENRTKAIECRSGESYSIC
ncbi:DUF1376 domain-containing protein [Bartonella saheliensis]|uniref:DUF1376 domain-containing protein n=1 Tax=Bartonella saheliensis TaxID=1457016 RepID=UPI0011A887CB|nr:DUF1376 domain-containing protein [Bartonella saheliensis]